MRNNRVLIKPLSETSISEQYLKWMNNPEVLKYTESRWKKYDENDLKIFVHNMNKSQNDYLFGIYTTDTGKHIGNIKIGNVNQYHRFANLGVIIGAKEEWGKGYATEAIKLAVDYAFTQLKLYKIIAGVYVNNFASIKALKKVGFIECGVHINHCVFDDYRVDTLTLEIINEGKNNG